MRKAAVTFSLLALFSLSGAHAQPLSPSQTINLGWGIGGIPGIGPGFGVTAGIGAGGTSVGSGVDLEFDVGAGQLNMPARLLPAERGGGGNVATGRAVATEFTPRHAAPGTSLATVASCRNAIAKAATRYGAVYVSAASAGATRRSGRGVTAPIEARVLYSRSRNGVQARQSLVNCRLDAGGRVVRLS
jgi:hypothetical protein